MDIDNTEEVKTGVHIQLKNKYTSIYFIESYLSNIYSGMIKCGKPINGPNIFSTTTVEKVAKEWPFCIIYQLCNLSQ